MSIFPGPQMGSPQPFRRETLRTDAMVDGVRLFRLSLLCLFAGAAIGCANVLGLDEMSFEKRLEEEEPPPMQQPPKEDPVLVGLGGSAPGGAADPVYEDKDFPRLLPAQARIVSAPQFEPNSHYWIYNPDARTIETLLLDGDGVDSLGVQAWDSLASYTHLAVVSSGDRDAVFGYDQNSGALSLATDLDGAGDLTLLSEDVGSVERDVVLSFPLGESFLVLSATSEDGHYRYFNADPEAGLDVVSGTWDAGFTSIAPFTYGGDEGVLKLDPVRGVLAFDRLVQYGEPFENVFEVTAPVAAQILITFFADGIWRVGLYEPITGAIGSGNFGPLGEGVTYYSVDSSFFREGMTSLTVVYSEGVPYAITFSPASAVAQIRSLWPLDDSPIIVK